MDAASPGTVSHDAANAGGFGGVVDGAPYGGGFGGAIDGAPYGGGGWSGADGSSFGGCYYGPNPDGAPPCGGTGGLDASLDAPDACTGSSEISCLAAQQNGACSAYYGWKVPGGPKQFVLCDQHCIGGAAFSCSVDPNGVCWLFPDTCVPTGWTGIWDCNADAAPACAGAFETPNGG